MMLGGCVTTSEPRLFELGTGEVIQCTDSYQSVCGLNLSECMDGSEIYCSHDVRAIPYDVE